MEDSMEVTCVERDVWRERSDIITKIKFSEVLTFSESEQLTEEETPLISAAMVETLLEAGFWSTKVMTARWS